MKNHIMNRKKIDTTSKNHERWMYSAISGIFCQAANNFNLIKYKSFVYK